ncbi:hypothetical protein OQA88_7359 [Cercophora sp. LCS_1]
MADKRTTAQLDRLTLYPATPPETASPNSPTPSVSVDLPVSRVDKIIAELHNRICGRAEFEEWWCISLSRDEFKAFEARFEAEGHYRWPKYDYFPQLAKFVLRMAGTLHEAVIGSFGSLVTEQLIDIRRGNDQIAADFARDVHPTGSPKIERDGSSHRPDRSFAHEDTTEFGVILEVSHSQKYRDLPFLADDYILGSNGLTQAVIGIDLDYQGKGARVMVWRPKTTEKEISTKKTFEGTFRDVNGNLVNGGQNLRIWLKDFGNELDCPGIQKVQGVIAISFTQLYELVQEGEAFDQARKRRRGSDEVFGGKIVKRKMVRPSPEELFKTAEKKSRSS